MRIIRDVLRLHFETGLSQRQISRCLTMGLGTVSLYLKRTEQAGLTWPLPDTLDDASLERLLFPGTLATARSGYIEPDYAAMHTELKRKGVTKQLLWEEYCQAYGDKAYKYSQYCQRYRDWSLTLKRSMRQVHKAGEKLFIDYCGPTIPIINPDTGEVVDAQIFVATWGASNYTYAEATRSQKKSDWISSHSNAFEFFGGVPQITVPDNLRSAVSKSCRYEPVINESYLHFAQHYNTVVTPARPYKPKDKAKVENAVLVVERWIMARLRHMMFFTLAELNQHIRILLKDLNNRPFKKLPGSRQSQFELLDKPAMKPLPAKPYQYTQFKLARVNIDYHIEYDKHYYSVPHHLVKHQVDVQATRDTVTLQFKGKLIATHVRSQRQGAFTTNKAHMPTSHRKQGEWSAQRLHRWAQDLGPNVVRMVDAMVHRRAHPEQAYRSCLGLLNLSRSYDADRLDKACERALLIGSCDVRSVKSILRQGLDQLDLPLEESSTEQETLNTQSHDNIRGPHYYH